MIELIEKHKADLLWEFPESRVSSNILLEALEMSNRTIDHSIQFYF